MTFHESFCSAKNDELPQDDLFTKPFSKHLPRSVHFLQQQKNFFKILFSRVFQQKKLNAKNYVKIEASVCLVTEKSSRFVPL